MVANVVGQVSIGKIVKVASRFNKIPKDFLKKLTGAIPAAEAKSEPPAEGTAPAGK